MSLDPVLVDDEWHEAHCMAVFDGRCDCDRVSAKADALELLYEQDLQAREDAAAEALWDR